MVTRIVLNLPELERLARHRSIPYKIGNTSIELSLESDITPRLLIGVMLDVLNGRQDTSPGDPPEAREFLPRRRHGRPGK